MAKASTISKLLGVKKDGTQIDVSLAVSPITDRHGQIVGVSKIARDITQHKRAAQKLLAQLGRLDLLNGITHAIDERQDLPSIFQVVIRTLEDQLPIDFGCICMYDATDNLLTVSSVGIKGQPLASEMALTEQTRIAIDSNGLSRCIRGPIGLRTGHQKFAIPVSATAYAWRTAFARHCTVDGGGERVRRTDSLPAAQWKISPATTANFSDSLADMSLWQHIKRSSTALCSALMTRLRPDAARRHAAGAPARPLGQMASGIAHDINNAISPAMLYTESLLEREPNLSEQGRRYLITIQRAIEDVAQTVMLLREFYRPQEFEQQLTDVELNRLIGQVLDLTRARWSDQPQLRGAIIELKTDLAADLPDIRGVESDIRDALTNLIFNSVDAGCRTAACLRLRTQRGLPSLLLTVNRNATFN